MTNINVSLIVLLSSTLSYAGGDFKLLTPYEIEENAYIENTSIEEVVVEAPNYVEEQLVEASVPPPKKLEDIYANGFYAGLGIVTARYQTSCKNCSKAGTDKTIGFVARGGYDFNQYIGLEVRGIRSSLQENGGAVKHAGVFIKPMIPVGEKSNIYGLVGLAKTTTQGHLQRTSAETLAMGLGVEVDLSKDTPKNARYGRAFDGKGDQEKGIGMFVDYEKMVVSTGAPDLDALSAGVTYDF